MHSMRISDIRTNLIAGNSKRGQPVCNRGDQVLCCSRLCCHILAVLLSGCCRRHFLRPHITCGNHHCGVHPSDRGFRRHILPREVQQWEGRSACSIALGTGFLLLWGVHRNEGEKEGCHPQRSNCLNSVFLGISVFPCYCLSLRFSV